MSELDGERYARLITEGITRAEDVPPAPMEPARVVERAWRFVTMLDEIAASRDGSVAGHIVALIARELRDCLNDDDTGGMALPKMLYDDGKEPHLPGFSIFGTATTTPVVIDGETYNRVDDITDIHVESAIEAVLDDDGCPPKNL